MKKCKHEGARIISSGLFRIATAWWCPECGATKFTYEFLKYKHKRPGLTNWRLPKREIQRNKED